MPTREALALTPMVAGIDEAGRGPLAGPVVAAAVLLPEDFPVEHLNDSKKLSAAQRAKAEHVIREHAAFAIARIEHDEIDRINILQATMVAMERALSRLEPRPKAALVDGNRIPAMACVPTSAIVKGDGLYAAIAAASILAKTERDRIMAGWASEYPEYGFDRHFGYPTPDHLEALRRLGPSPIHRQSFEPVRSFSRQLCLSLGD